MKETGILMTPENHRLIMSGTKVQTRRVISPQPNLEPNVGFVWKGRAYGRGMYDSDQDRQAARNFVHKCPHGSVGDKLYVKEGVIVHKDEGWPKITGKKAGDLIGYYMDGARVTNLGEKRLTAMFMPKRFARTWLEITEVRVERVQDISEEDAKAEGVEQRSRTTWRNYFEDCYLSSAQQSYSSLWQAINGKNKPGKEWDAWDLNPFVWAITFRKI